MQQAFSAPWYSPSPTHDSWQVLSPPQYADELQHGFVAEHDAPLHALLVQKPLSQTRPVQQSDVSPQPAFSGVQVALHVLTFAPAAIPQYGDFSQQPPAPKPALHRSPLQFAGKHFAPVHARPAQHCSSDAHSASFG
jgi:hypothetical protein